jgi:hypothetical protein
LLKKSYTANRNLIRALSKVLLVKSKINEFAMTEVDYIAENIDITC